MSKSAGYFWIHISIFRCILVVGMLLMSIVILIIIVTHEYLSVNLITSTYVLTRYTPIPRVSTAYPTTSLTSYSQQQPVTKQTNILSTKYRCNSFHNYSIALISRTYAGDYNRMKKWLLPTYQMFIDFNCIEVIFVFDNTTKDYEIANKILKKYPNYKIYHEALPRNYKHILNQHIFLGPGYNRFGYDRQLWSTWWLDNYTNADVIGIIDSDSQIFSFITENTIFMKNNSNIIKLQCILPDHFEGTRKALQFRDFIYYDFMWTDRFPQWFWKETFSNTRQYLMKKYKQNTFDDAYAIFATQRLCQFNTLYDYGIKFESDRYKIYPCRDGIGMVSVACNRCREIDILYGCCYNFGKKIHAQCPQKTDYEFIWRYNNCDIKWKNENEIIRDYTHSLVEKLNEMNETQIQLKVLNCITYLGRRRKHSYIDWYFSSKQ